MHHAAVCYLVRKSGGRTEVCLSKKKRGYGAGLFHAYGGIIEPPETSSQCAIRETREEAGISVSESHVRRVAIVSTFAQRHAWRVDVFTCEKWRGEPAESEENGPPQWFPLEDLPYDDMFPDRKYWLRRVLSGEALVVQTLLSEDGKAVELASIRPLCEYLRSQSA